MTPGSHTRSGVAHSQQPSTPTSDEMPLQEPSSGLPTIEEESGESDSSMSGYGGAEPPHASRRLSDGSRPLHVQHALPSGAEVDGHIDADWASQALNLPPAEAEADERDVQGLRRAAECLTGQRGASVLGNMEGHAPSTQDSANARAVLVSCLSLQQLQQYVAAKEAQHGKLQHGPAGHPGTLSDALGFWPAPAGLTLSECGSAAAASSSGQPRTSGRCALVRAQCPHANASMSVLHSPGGTTHTETCTVRVAFAFVNYEWFGSMCTSS